MERSCFAVPWFMLKVYERQELSKISLFCDSRCLSCLSCGFNVEYVNQILQCGHLRKSYPAQLSFLKCCLLRCLSRYFSERMNF